MSTKKCQLKCRVQRGMFDDEFLVILTIVDQNTRNEVEAAAFVDRDELEVESYPEGDDVVDGFLSVSLMGIEKNNISVVLPKTTLSNGPVVMVKRSDLSLNREKVAR